MTKTFEEYQDFYREKNRLLDGQLVRQDKKLNYKQLQEKYKKYVRGLERKEEKKGQKSDYMKSILEVETECRLEDPTANIFYNKVNDIDQLWGTDYESYFIKQNRMMNTIYDPAHIIPRARSPRLANEKLNIIMLPRFVHTLIDSYREVFSYEHESIDAKRQEEIWRLIVGTERYEKLLSMM